jgi:hypothetical protein
VWHTPCFKVALRRKFHFLCAYLGSKLCCVVLCCDGINQTFSIEPYYSFLPLLTLLCGFCYRSQLVWFYGCSFCGFHFGLGCIFVFIIIHLLLLLISWAMHPNVVFFIKKICVCMCVWRSHFDWHIANVF